MSVRRMRDEDPRRDPAATRRRAVIRFALWETPGFIALVAALVLIHGGAAPEGAALTYTAVAIAVFAIYVGILVVRILLPAMKGSADAR